MKKKKLLFFAEFRFDISEPCSSDAYGNENIWHRTDYALNPSQENAEGDGYGGGDCSDFGPSGDGKSTLGDETWYNKLVYEISTKT